jgi:omega-6 fatty acid desaturase (delta-12 desaturase)
MLETNPTVLDSAVTPEAERALLKELAVYARPVPGRSLLQIAAAFGPFLAACALAYWAYGVSPWLAAALAVPAGALLVRVFIVQHDCGHRSFFAARWANDALGVACSLLTLAPYAHWRRQHAGHHGNWNNLDRRESGADIYSSCLTTAEFRALPWRQRLIYRATRHPLVANIILPPLVFGVLYRVPFDTPKDWRLERLSVHATNAGLIALFGALGLALGFDRMAVIQFTVLVVASTIGVWLFSVQHRFETAHWSRQDKWTYMAASLEGSSYLRLPAALRWLTGSIGLHHVHHLNSRVPNYRLQERCDRVMPLGAIPSMGLRCALRAMWLALWDEERGRLVSFREARR